MLQEVLSKRESVLGRNNQSVAETYRTLGQMYMVSSLFLFLDTTTTNSSGGYPYYPTHSTNNNDLLLLLQDVLPSVILPLFHNNNNSTTGSSRSGIPNISAAISSLITSSVMMVGTTQQQQRDDVHQQHHAENQQEDDDSSSTSTKMKNVITKAISMYRTYHRIQVVLYGTASVGSFLQMERSDFAIALSALQKFNTTVPLPSPASGVPGQHHHGHQAQHQLHHISRSMNQSIQYEMDGDNLRRFLQLPKAVVEYQKAARIEQLLWGVDNNPDLCYVWRKIACLTSIKHMDPSGSSAASSSSKDAKNSRTDADGGDVNGGDPVSINTDESAWEVCDRVSGKWFRHQPKGSLYPRVCSVIKKGDDYYKSQRYDNALKEYWKAATIKISDSSDGATGGSTNDQQHQQQHVGPATPASSSSIVTPTGSARQLSKTKMVISTSSHSARSIFRKPTQSVRTLIQKELFEFFGSPDSRLPIIPDYYPPRPESGPDSSFHVGSSSVPSSSSHGRSRGGSRINKMSRHSESGRGDGRQYKREYLDKKTDHTENKSHKYPSQHQHEEERRQPQPRRPSRQASAGSESTEEISNRDRSPQKYKEHQSQEEETTTFKSPSQRSNKMPFLNPPTPYQSQPYSQRTVSSSYDQTSAGTPSQSSSQPFSIRSYNSKATPTNQQRPPVSSAGDSTFRPESVSSQIASATTPIPPSRQSNAGSAGNAIREDENENSHSDGTDGDTFANADGFDPDDGDDGAAGGTTSRQEAFTPVTRDSPRRTFSAGLAPSTSSVASSSKAGSVTSSSKTPQRANMLKRASSFSYIGKLAQKSVRGAKKKTGRALGGLSQSMHKGFDMGLDMGLGKKKSEHSLMEDVSIASLGFDPNSQSPSPQEKKKSRVGSKKAGKRQDLSTSTASQPKSPPRKDKPKQIEMASSEGDASDDLLPQKPTRRKSFDNVLSPIPPSPSSKSPSSIPGFADFGGKNNDYGDEDSIDIVDIIGDEEEEESDSTGTPDQTLKERFINTSSVVVNLLETMKSTQSKNNEDKNRLVVRTTLIELVENVQDMSAILQRQTFRLHIVINDGNNISGTTEEDFIDSIERTAEARTHKLDRKTDEKLCEQIDQIFEECDEILSLAITTSDAAASQQQSQHPDGEISPRLDGCVKTFALEQTFVKQLRKGYVLQSASIVGDRDDDNESSSQSSSSVSSGESFATEDKPTRS
mmetsp:Transcript_49973/g.121069  ORF Transcript_49973/g.121069 Transcript_49973/m.121069 type:complete len:1205 (+) Transcript_49973:458-4072(+)